MKLEEEKREEQAPRKKARVFDWSTPSQEVGSQTEITPSTMTLPRTSSDDIVYLPIEASLLPMLYPLIAQVYQSRATSTIVPEEKKQ